MSVNFHARLTASIYQKNNSLSRIAIPTVFFLCNKTFYLASQTIESQDFLLQKL